MNLHQKKKKSATKPSKDLHLLIKIALCEEKFATNLPWICNEGRQSLLQTLKDMFSYRPSINLQQRETKSTTSIQSICTV
jgi:hypothetical protein